MAYWSKRENDLMFDWGDGVAKQSAGMLQSKTCHREHNFNRLTKDEPVEWPSLLEELEARGFDLTTLKFSIQKKAHDSPQNTSGISSHQSAGEMPASNEK